MAITDRLTRHKVFVERFAGSVNQRAQDYLARARDFVLQRSLTNDNPNDIAEGVKSIFDEMSEDVKTQIEDFAINETDFVARVLEAETGREFNRPDNQDVIDKIYNKNMPVGLAQDDRNRNINVAFGKFAEDKSKQLTQPIRDAEVNGEDTASAGERVAAIAGGLLAIQAASLVKTSIAHAEDVSKVETFLANRSEIEEVEWVSTLDSRTTDYCRGQDGKRYKIGQGPRPPAHYNCRSITRPVLRNE